jgi:hypothetical protein
LRRCLKALEASDERQTIEIIVMDNGSRDDTAEVELEYPEVTFLRLPKYFGRTKALNIASRTAHADLLFYLSPDVEVTPAGGRVTGCAHGGRSGNSGCGVPAAGGCRRPARTGVFSACPRARRSIVCGPPAAASNRRMQPTPNTRASTPSW